MFRYWEAFFVPHVSEHECALALEKGDVFFDVAGCFTDIDFKVWFEYFVWKRTTVRFVRIRIFLTVFKEKKTYR